MPLPLSCRALLETTCPSTFLPHTVRKHCRFFTKFHFLNNWWHRCKIMVFYRFHLVYVCLINCRVSKNFYKVDIFTYSMYIYILGAKSRPRLREAKFKKLLCKRFASFLCVLKTDHIVLEVRNWTFETRSCFTKTKRL